ARRGRGLAPAQLVKAWHLRRAGAFMKRLILIVLIALFATVETAPVLAQAGERFEVAQQQKRRTLFDLLFGEEPKPAAPVQQTQPRRAPWSQAALPPPAPTIEKA